MWRARRAGLAALEFALIAPVLLILLLGTIDASGALLTARRLQAAAGAVAAIGTTLAAQTATLDQLTDVQAWQATTAPFAFFSTWSGKLAQGTFAITLSDVDFTATPAGCTQACTYTAHVRWSLANDLGQPRLRPCGTLAAAANSDATSYTTLPAGDFGKTSLLVADISYTFLPVFLGFLFGPIPMMQSAYVSPRIDSGTVLLPIGGKGTAKVCPVAT